MSGYCNWCDTTTNRIIKIFDGRILLWSGCRDCYEKKKELEKNDGLAK